MDDLRNLRDLRGTPAFAGALAERERALGLLDPAPAASTPTAPPTVAPKVAPAVEVPAEALADTLTDTLTDAWGNTILAMPGHLGQYRLQSARDGRILRVCGEATNRTHLSFWEYDEDERRYVCRVCWPIATAAQMCGETETEGKHA